MLTTNLSDIKMRALNEQGSVPMDGLFTQRNKVFLKVTNHGNEDMTLQIPFCAYHSSYVCDIDDSSTSFFVNSRTVYMGWLESTTISVSSRFGSNVPHLC